MRSRLLAAACLATVAACAVVAVRAEPAAAKVRLRLTDPATGKPVPGVVRVVADAEPLPLAGLIDRCRGMAKSDAARGWYVVPADGAVVELPRKKLTVEAFQGIETALARTPADLTANVPDTLDVPLAFLFRPADLGLVPGNTHLHLKDMTREEADDYLRRVPPAEGLRVLFTSYLERENVGDTYVTNRLPTGDLDRYRGNGVAYNHGEEYRHNFGPGGQGYGHVMLLNLKERILPASVGPGITGAGTDDTPLRGGIDNARNQGATVIWCHNTFGHEDVPSVLAGRVDAVNLFDGSRRDSFEQTYYKFLNVGLRLPVSTGTDWFLDDFSRVYVAGVADPVTPAGWLAGLKAGRNSMTNGPLLTLTVDGKPPGSVLAADGPRKVAVEASALGRHDFEQLELVRNGTVIERWPAARKDGAYRVSGKCEVKLDGPAWLALRVISTARNEFGTTPFAHTSPVYVDVAGRRPFVLDDALALLKMVELAKEEIPANGKFSGPAGKAAVLAVYDEAAKTLNELIAARK